MTPHRARARLPVSSRRWRLHLARHVPVAIEGRDDEGVHQVRVAAGRLAVWLEMGGRSVLRDDLRTLRREAAAVRDCDVLLARGVPAAFAERLRARREEARATMIAHLSSQHARALRAALAVLPSIAPETAEASLAAFRERVLGRGDRLAAHAAQAAQAAQASRAPRSPGRAPRGGAAAPDPGAVGPPDEDFHDVRRAVRKLRYASEWLGHDTGTIKDVQQVFGDLNDLAVESRLLAETGAAALCPAYARRLESRLAAARHRALRTWTRARPHLAAEVPK